MRTALAIALGFIAVRAEAGAGQASFTPTSYKYPVMRISIAMADGTNDQALYTCPNATPEECMLDLGDAASLSVIETAAAAVAIREGTYTHISLSNCPIGTPNSAMTSIEVTGTADVGGSLFHTSATAVGGMSLTGSVEATSIPWACGGANVELHTPLVVAEGSMQQLSLLVDLTYAVWSDASASPGLGGCKSDGGAGQDICGSFPLVVPYVGTGTPTFERYLISHAASGTAIFADANAAVNMGIDPSGEVFYIGDQPFYSATSTNDGPDYFAGVRTFSKNTDGSIAFQAGGSEEDHRVGFTAFERATHTGTCQNEGAGATVWSYQAFKQ